MTLSESKSRAVAITFDDLPVASITRKDNSHYQEVTNKLLDSITANGIPAIGFVNESKLYRKGKWYRKRHLDDERVALLQQWLDSGLELGNHTFSHPDLHATAIDTFKADIVRGETVMKKLMQPKGMRLRYFRHPFLHTGTDIMCKRNLEEFLTERGYQVAPGTVGNSDWIFAAAYSKAAQRGDKELMRRVATAYITRAEADFDYAEKQSVALFGYEIKQVLVIHANALNADHFGELVESMKRRGYSFVSLDEALSDNAYDSPDAYVGPKGIKWLLRWALTAGKPEESFAPEPKTPEFVLKELSAT